MYTFLETVSRLQKETVMSMILKEEDRKPFNQVIDSTHELGMKITTAYEEYWRNLASSNKYLKEYLQSH
jgi:hypothetical protein